MRLIGLMALALVAGCVSTLTDPTSETEVPDSAESVREPADAKDAGVDSFALPKPSSSASPGPVTPPKAPPATTPPPSSSPPPPSSPSPPQLNCVPKASCTYYSRSNGSDSKILCQQYSYADATPFRPECDRWKNDDSNFNGMRAVWAESGCSSAGAVSECAYGSSTSAYCGEIRTFYFLPVYATDGGGCY